MNRYLLDAGVLYGFVDEADLHHEQSVELLARADARILLPIPAITEVAYFISRNLGIARLGDFLAALPATSLILEAPVPDDYRRSAEILRKYNDANIDFVDSCIVAMAERMNITKILTIDRRDFGSFRPKHCESFEILP